MNHLTEHKIAKKFIAIAALSAMIATLLGAFAAHALGHYFSDYQMRVFQTGVLYQFIHSLALLSVGLVLLHVNHRFIEISGILFVAGIVLFSGSLYTISFLQLTSFGMLTPVGGLSFIMGWCLFAIGIYKG